MHTNNKNQNKNYWQFLGRLKNLFVALGVHIGETTLENFEAFLAQPEHLPILEFLGIYPTDMHAYTHYMTYIDVFIAALFTMVKTQKLSKCSSAERMDK